MPRILQVLNHLNHGGQELQVINFFKHIDSRFEFVFLTISKEPPYGLAKLVEQKGGNIYYIPMDGSLPIKRKDKKRLEQLILEERIDIIHIHPKADYIASVAKHMKVPLIVHSHSSSFRLPDSFFPKIYKYMKYHFIVRPRLRNGDILVACGRAAGSFLFGKKSFQIIPNGIDLEKYKFNPNQRSELREKLGIEADSNVLLNVGRMAYPKNQAFLIDIFKEYMKLDSNAVLLLIGDGPDLPSIKAKVKNCFLDKDVIFSGSLDSKDFYNVADIFVLPSFHEGLPITVIEAQANGLPSVVSSSISTEADITGEVTFTSLEQTATEWASTLNEKISKRFYGADLIKGGPYDINQATKLLEEVYDSVSLSN